MLTQPTHRPPHRTEGSEPHRAGRARRATRPPRHDSRWSSLSRPPQRRHPTGHAPSIVHRTRSRPSSTGGGVPQGRPPPVSEMVDPCLGPTSSSAADGTFYVGSTYGPRAAHQTSTTSDSARSTPDHAGGGRCDWWWASEFNRMDEAFWYEKQIQGWGREKRVALSEGEPRSPHRTRQEPAGRSRRRAGRGQRARRARLSRRSRVPAPAAVVSTSSTNGGPVPTPAAVVSTSSTSGGPVRGVAAVARSQPRCGGLDKLDLRWPGPRGCRGGPVPAPAAVVSTGSTSGGPGVGPVRVVDRGPARDATRPADARQVS